MCSSTSNQDVQESPADKTEENVEKDQDKKKSGKSNSELMAEFFSIISEEPKK